jgi:hypothetical protein
MQPHWVPSQCDGQNWLDLVMLVTPVVVVAHGDRFSVLCSACQLPVVRPPPALTAIVYWGQAFVFEFT